MAVRKAEPRDLYKARAGEPELVRVPAMSFVMIDGRGDPNTAAEYRDAIGALYAISYGLKFSLKKESGLDYRVSPLEGLWWSDDADDFRLGLKSNWSWTAMIAQPAQVTPRRFSRIVDETRRKKDLPALDKARLERFKEGLAAQVLHVGPFSAEGPTIEKLHAFIHDHGYTFDGRKQKHHEIYLSDPRRSAPAKWKTVIRQPVATRPGSQTSG